MLARLDRLHKCGNRQPVIPMRFPKFGQLVRRILINTYRERGVSQAKPFFSPRDAFVLFQLSSLFSEPSLIECQRVLAEKPVRTFSQGSLWHRWRISLKVSILSRDLVEALVIWLKVSKNGPCVYVSFWDIAFIIVSWTYN